MENVSKENVEKIINALTEYYKKIITTRQLNLQEFVNFMEPKFADAGYRTPPPPPPPPEGVKSTF